MGSLTRPACALAVLLTGCLRTTAFHCADDAQCQLGSLTGVCELVGFCSFADPTCATGRRFGELADSYSGQCIAESSPPDAPAPPFCDAATEPALVGCWELDGDLIDRSGDSNDGTGTAVTFEPGPRGLAARLAAASHIAVADSASLTSPAITIEAWIEPSALPAAGTRMGILDNQGQYGLFLHPTSLVCVTTTAAVTVATDRWTHVACTYDGAVGRLYVDGLEAAMTGGGTPLGPGDTSGTALGGNSPSGEPLVGRLDQVRVWNVARTAAQICRAAERADCP